MPEKRFKWKSVKLSSDISADDACFLSLEEIVDTNETPTIDQPEIEDIDADALLDSMDFIPIDDFVDPEAVEEPLRPSKKPRITQDQSNIDQLPIDSQWTQFELHPSIIKALEDNGFAEPTQIQAQTLSQCLGNYKDVIGAAETGSGKTLAFGLPILNHIASTIASTRCTSDSLGVVALVLTPTRELAIQVSDQLKRVCQPRSVSNKIVPVVGGMSTQKQCRMLAMRPVVVVATPGRLWELMQQDSQLLDSLRRCKFLVLDEADRMLEKGHFKDLDDILGHVSIKNLPNEEQRIVKRQVMVFSATMLNNPDLKQKASSSYPSKPNKNVSVFDKLLKKVEFRDKSPIYINLSRNDLIAKGVHESSIECVKTDKDLMLYYLLCRYPGKTIVFVNSIDAIRRLVPILTKLGVSNVFGLHAEMQQRQRLKNLDRFKTSQQTVLVASDVAARGLDIPQVDHVVHYQLPRTADVYVHRSGRTARANSEGVSVMLCSPEEVKSYKKVCQSLGKKNGLPSFPVDHSVLSALRQRLQLAKEIDSIEHRHKKKQSEKNWIRNAAEECDILISDNDDDEERRDAMSEKDKCRVLRLKAQLNALLGTPLVQKGISAKYLTGNVDSNLPELLMNSNNPLMPAMTQDKARHHLQKQSRK